MPSAVTELDRLAIFGGPPIFPEPRHVGRPNIGDRARLLERLAGVIDSGWLTNDGPLVDEFEARVAELSGADHCVAVANATLGMQLAAVALGVSGEIVMPAFTFVATAHAMSWLGLRPVFAEIDPETHTLDPAAVERALTPRTGAILGVHLWGRGDHAERLLELGAHHGVPVIFDAAHALACDTPVGAAAVISFHATKVANSAEGGAILTADDELAYRLRRTRNFGFVDYDTVRWLGTNAKMSELSAAMGLNSLESLDVFLAVNHRNHECYARGLEGLAGTRLHRYDGRNNHHYVVLEVPPGVRDDLIAVLQAENVRARRYFHPGVHRHQPYAETAPPLPVTEAVSSRVVALPTGTAMSTDDIGCVCSVIRVALENAGELQHRLRAGGLA